MIQRKKIGLSILAVFIICTLAAGIISAQTVDWQTLLKQTMPEADKFSQITGLESYKSRSLTKAVFPAYKNGTQIGVIFYAAPQGYGGNIQTLTALDMNGVIRKVNIFSHNETPSYVVDLNNGSYQRQFEGITLTDQLSFLIGTRPSKRGDVMAMTGATETSKPIAFAVSEARKLFTEMYKR